MDYLNDNNFYKFTHKLYPSETACLLPNSKLLVDNNPTTICWKFKDCSIIRVSSCSDAGVNFSIDVLKGLGY